MELFTLNDDKTLFCSTVHSFPEGVTDAFKELERYAGGRDLYGISWMTDDGKIVYRTAAEEQFPGEGLDRGYENMIIKKGDYLVIKIQDYMKKLESIGEAFTKMMADSRMDKQHPCVEWYKGDFEMWCMVRVRNNEN